MSHIYSGSLPGMLLAAVPSMSKGVLRSKAQCYRICGSNLIASLARTRRATATRVPRQTQLHRQTLLRRPRVTGNLAFEFSFDFSDGKLQGTFNMPIKQDLSPSGPLR